MSDAGFVGLGELNSGWGICGFTSTFYAMHHLNPGTRGWLVNATQVFSVLYEIVDYLRALQAANSPLIREIEVFTRSFGPTFANFTVADYIKLVEEAGESARYVLAFGSDAAQSARETNLKKNALFSIGVPPQGVVDYIERMWKWKATLTEFKAANLTEDAIVGVRDPNDPNMTMYHGLRHYLFRAGGRYFSWGLEFDTLQDAANHVRRTYEICYAITVRKY